jgi:hypothetical protein
MQLLELHGLLASCWQAVQSLMCLLEQVKPWTQMEMEASHRGMVPSRTRARVLSR